MLTWSFVCIALPKEIRMKRGSIAKIMLTGAMVTFGTIGLLVRNIALGSGEIALYRAALAVLLIGAFLLVSRKRFDFSGLGRELLLLFLSGAAMAFNWILLFEAYNYTTVSVATLSYYFAPVIVTVLCPILFKEKMGARQWICFAASTLGIVLITGFGDISGGRHFIGVLLGLGAACFYASVVIINKLIKGVAGIQRTFVQSLSAIVVLLPYVALTGGFHISSLDGVGWAALLTVGLIHTGVAYCLYFSSLKDISGQESALLSYIDPLVAVVMSVAVLGEPLLPLQALGGVLILGFTLYNEFSSARDDEPESENFPKSESTSEFYRRFKREAGLVCEDESARTFALTVEGVRYKIKETKKKANKRTVIRLENDTVVFLVETGKVGLGFDLVMVFVGG